MTEKILEQILSELQAIRAALNALPLPPPSPAKTSPATGQGQPGTAPAVVPQPAMIIDHPGAITVHFGKNTGKALSELGERSLEWYASEKPAKTDSSGKPYPPRESDTLLENAARTLWHQKRGTLAGPQPPLALTPIAEGPDGQDSVPF